MSENISALIEKLEDERYAALLAGDLATLDRLFDDRLRYIHSNSQVDSKASYFAALREGRFKYLSIAREERTVVPLNEAALVFSVLRIDVEVGGAARKVNARAIAVWSRSGQDWRLAAVQTTAIPAA